MVKPKTFERMLEVQLTVEEINERAIGQAKLVIDRKKLKAEAKNKAEGYAAEIKLIEQKIESEASVIEEGKEFRKVQCTEQEAANGIEIETIRNDTGEVIETRAKTEQERQGDLFEFGQKIEEFKHDADAVIENQINAAKFLGVQREADDRIEYEERCNECDTKNGHQASCSQYVTASGTPIETELTGDEIQRIATFNCCDKLDKIDTGEPLKTTLINNEPYLVTGSSSHYGRYDSIWAHPILPIGIHGEANTRTRADAYKEYESNELNSALSLINVKFNAGSKKKPDWWVIVGEQVRFSIRIRSRHTLEDLLWFAKTHTSVTDPEKMAHQWLESGEQDQTVAELLKQRVLTPDKPDDFTAERCDECHRIEGAHSDTCSKRNMISYATYFAYAEAQKMKHPASWARKAEIKRDKDDEVRAWIEAEQGSPDPETGTLLNIKPEEKPKRRGKLQLVEERSYEAGL